MHVRAHNPTPWVPWLVTTALAGAGVTGFVLGRRALRAPSSTNGDDTNNGANGNGSGGGAPGGGLQVTGMPIGGAAGSTALDDQAMRRGVVGVYTSWFTQEVEQEIISRMTAYRNQRGISSCLQEYKAIQDPGGIGFIDQAVWLREASSATTEALNSLYPNGRPWDPNQFYELANSAAAEGGDVTLWRWWLWKRVYQLAEQHVCQYFSPV